MAQSTVNRYRPPRHAQQPPRHIFSARSGRRGRQAPTPKASCPGRLRRRLHMVGVLLGGALLNPPRQFHGLTIRRVARGHGASSIVNWVENEWYSHHPHGGGTLPRCDSHAFRVPTNQFDFRGLLPTPKPIVPFASPPSRRRRLVTGRSPRRRRSGDL